MKLIVIKNNCIPVHECLDEIISKQNLSGRKQIKDYYGDSRFYGSF